MPPLLPPLAWLPPEPPPAAPDPAPLPPPDCWPAWPPPGLGSPSLLQPTSNTRLARTPKARPLLSAWRKAHDGDNDMTQG